MEKIHKKCFNGIVEMMTERDSVAPRRYRRIAMEDWARATKTKGEHYEMYQAIVSGNAELAEELTTRHIMNAKKHMMEEMKFNG